MAAPTEPTFAPKQMHNISVVIDPDQPAPLEFRKATQSFQFVPAQSVTTTTGGTPDAVFTDVSPATWTLSWKLLQDIEASGSLQNWLIAHAGEQHKIHFTPFGGRSVEATILIAAVPIGGDMNAWLDGTATCGVLGAPVYVPAA